MEKPWLRLYHTPQWEYVRRQVMQRDGWRCTYVGCKATAHTATLEVHHLLKLQEHWRLARGSWERFTGTALDPAGLATVCTRHHMMIDRGGKP